MWPSLLKWIHQEPLKRKLISKKDADLVFVAKNNKEAMKIIKDAHQAYLDGNKNFCLNYKKYKLK